jgi:UTP:GlnB (protein PII) uridylyltransferase
MAITTAVASLVDFGISSTVRCSSVVKQDGAKSSLAAKLSSSAVGVPFVGGRGTYIPQEFVLAHNRRGLTIAQASIIAMASLVQGGRETEKAEPIPMVTIDQHTDPDSTIVELSFGDRLGALLDTMKALKNLGLNVVKAQVTTDETSTAKNKFYITRSDNGNKVENPELLEAIRLTIINNLLKYHPESSEQLYMGETFGLSPPKVKLDVDVATHVSVKKVNPKLSVLSVETADRPGLLLDIVKVVTEISVMVESAEINTEGLVAKDQFYVSYGGQALSKSLEEVLTNCLRYHIRKFESEEESY